MPNLAVKLPFVAEYIINAGPGLNFYPVSCLSDWFFRSKRKSQILILVEICRSHKNPFFCLNFWKVSKISLLFSLVSQKSRTKSVESQNFAWERRWLVERNAYAWLAETQWVRMNHFWRMVSREKKGHKTKRSRNAIWYHYRKILFLTFF